ncbi:MAG: hypothetical protein ACPGJS_03160 [Flammeovirgaceae bacterium]
MHALSLSRRTYLTIYGVPLFIILASVSLALSPLLQQNPALVMGITYDLTLLGPLLYLILIWNKKIPKITVVPFFIIGLALSSLLLPENTHLSFMKSWVLPLIELVVLGTITYKVIQLRKAYQTQKGEDFLAMFRKCGAEVLGNRLLANALATEASVVHYAFFNWKKRPSVPNAYTYHLKSGIGGTLIGFIMVLLIETIALHFIAASWSVVLAWILTGSSIYCAIQLFAHMRSLAKRPILIGENSLTVRYGLFADATIDFSLIESVELFKEEQKEKGVKKVALLGELEEHNIRLRLKAKVPVLGVYGITKSYHTLLFFVDEKERFIADLELAMQGA